MWLSRQIAAKPNQQEQAAMGKISGGVNNGAPQPATGLPRRVCVATNGRSARFAAERV